MDKPKILIVDDESFFTDLLADLLAPQCQPLVARGGEEAIACLANEPPPELILLDILMPDMDGYAVCEKIKANPVTRDIPIIFLTIKSEVRDEIRGFELGGADYINKPISPPIVKARVNNHLELKQAREQLERDLNCRSADLKAREVQVFSQEQQLVQSNERLRNLIARVQQVREEERKKIARDVHDDLGQTLTALKMDMTWLRNHVNDQNNEIIAQADSMNAALDTAVEKVRDISYGLRPPPLDDFGLGAAIEWMVKDYGNRSGISMQLEMDDAVERFSFTDEIRTTVFRIVQESLTNVIRHSRADTAHIHYHAKDTLLTVTVEDNGKGIPQATLESHRAIGLIGMRERADAIGGELVIAPEEKTGTRVTLRVPLNGDGEKIP